MNYVNDFFQNVSYLYHLMVIQPAFVFIFIMLSGVCIIFSYGISACCDGLIGKSLSIILSLLFGILMIMSFLSPKDTYNKIVQNRVQAKKTIENCKLSGLNAQQGGLFGVNKDEWTCPDGMKIFLPEKYRP